jgi:sulfide dehydrogenase [flavocytochrome c] flavoprotein subunit
MRRRDFIKFSVMGGLASTLPLGACSLTPTKQATKLGKVVVVGGGYAGASCAKYLSIWSQGAIDVTVIEPNANFISCPLSNLVLSGSKRIQDLTFSYAALQKNYPINWVRDKVEAIDTTQRLVKTPHAKFAYDHLILAPGIRFDYSALPTMNNAQAQLDIPHAWKAGEQTERLFQQIQAMPAGGVFVMSIPKAPYRCPPGPYERVCQVAFYLKQNNPTAKIIVLDANPDIVSKKPLFSKVWQERYAGMIDYRPNSGLVEVDVNSRQVKTEFETVSSDVLNIIPAQQAGDLAKMAGLLNAQEKWVEVDFLSYASKAVKDVHVIGDAVASNLPKSAHMATSQAKVCAAAVVSILQQKNPDPTPVFANTCYSFVDDKVAMHVANVYRYDPAKQLMVAADGGGISQAPSEQEGKFAYAWANNIWSDVLT